MEQKLPKMILSFIIPTSVAADDRRSKLRITKHEVSGNEDL